MPKRLIDDSLLNSPSLEVLSPGAQDAFPRFILVADDFGCFELEPRQLWARGWPKRPDVTEQDVARWVIEMAERQAVGFDGNKAPPLLMLWTQAGRRYAFLTGWYGAHGQKRRAEYDPNAPKGTPGYHGSKRKTPSPPADLLAEVMAGNVRAIDGKPPGTDREDPGNADSETSNVIVPEREVMVSRSVPGQFPADESAFPGPVVPVAVPDPVPVAITSSDEPSRKLLVFDEVESPPAAEPLVLSPQPAPGAGTEALTGAAPAKAKAETKEPKDPRFAPMRAAWEELFLLERGEPYRWLAAKDAMAVHRLIAIPLDEFRERAVRGLRGSYRQRCSTLAELSAKWNDLAGGAPGVKQVTAAASDRTKFRNGEVPL